MYVQLFFPENRAVYKKMCKNTVETVTDDNITWHMRSACWITKATSTHSENVKLIAFPRQQLLPERASMLRYTFTVCLVHLP